MIECWLTPQIKQLHRSKHLANLDEHVQNAAMHQLDAMIKTAEGPDMDPYLPLLVEPPEPVASRVTKRDIHDQPAVARHAGLLLASQAGSHA